jgi:predicted dehydrogenase
VKVGFISCGHRARQLLGESPKDIDLVAVADCYLPKTHQFVELAADRRADICADASRVATYQDYRKMLEEENRLDAVVVATTTHARVLCCLHALAAGCDVYAEKPVTLTIEEGQVLGKAVRKQSRILQVGTQHRSLEINRWACNLVRTGGLGKIQKVVCMNYEGPFDWPSKPAEPTPEGLNWDLWCNQSPLVPYHSDFYTVTAGETWQRWRAYDGGGQSWGMTGWGTHAFDQVQWALGADDTSPVEIWPTKPGDPRSPVVARYANGITVEMKLPIRQARGPALGGVFIGSEGKLEINRNKVAANPPELIAGAPDPEIRKQAYTSSLAERHLKNWIDCVRTRTEPNCPVETGHRQTIICHLANIARDLGRRLQFDPESQRFVGDDEANSHSSMSRPRRSGYELPDLG